MRMRQEKFKKSYFIPAFGKSIEIRRNQDIDEDGVLGKELLAQYGEDCIIDGEKSLMEVVSNSKDAIANIEGMSASASEIDGKCTFNSNTITVVGDSIASQNGGGDDDGGENQYAVGSLNWFNFLSKHKLQYIFNKGVGGERTDQVLARMDDVLSSNANFYLFIIGKNDAVQTIDADTIISNLTQIYNLTLKSGAKVIATTIIPQETFVQTEVDIVEKVNNWIRNLSTTNKDIIVCDFFDALVNRSRGVALTDTIRDGIHPSVQGAYLLGRELHNKLSKFLPDINYFNSYNQATDFQLLANPYFVNGATTLDSWTDASSNGTLTKIPQNDGSVVAEYDCTSGANYLFQYVNSGFSDGDILEAIAEVEIDETATSIDQFQIYIQCKNGSDVIATRTFLQLATVESIRFPLISGVEGLLKTARFEVPVGTTQIIYYLQFNLVGKIRIGKCNLRKVY